VYKAWKCGQLIVFSLVVTVTYMLQYLSFVFSELCSNCWHLEMKLFVFRLWSCLAFSSWEALTSEIHPLSCPDVFICCLQVVKLLIICQILLYLWLCDRRKHDAMMPHNLFSLITDRLMLNSSGITLATYNVLTEVQLQFCLWWNLMSCKNCLFTTVVLS